MADVLAGGKLAEILAEMVELGLVRADISRRLYAAHGIEVSDPTLRRWITTLGSTRPETEAATA